MNADANTPATRSSTNALGTLNAAKNASSCGLAPKVAPITERRSQPRTRLATSAPIMTIDARATDIVTTESMGRGCALSSVTDGNEETQALRTQAHPSDAAPHLDQDPRSLGRAISREDCTRGAREGRRGRRDRACGGVEHPRPRSEARRGRSRLAKREAKAKKH